MRNRVVLEGQLQHLYEEDPFHFYWGPNLYMSRLSANIVVQLLKDLEGTPEWRPALRKFNQRLRITVEVLETNGED